MTIVKTAISLESELFKKAEKAAEKLNISRSRLFQLALENYINQYENLSILDRLNSVYSEKISEHEQDFQKLMKTYHGKHQEDKW